MSTNESSAAAQAYVVPQSPEARRALLRGFAQGLVDSGIADKALKVGDHLPPFTLPNAVGEMVSSKALLGRGPLVVSFYRGAWCPHCSRELHALQEVLPRIHALGAELVALSPNLPDSSLTTIEKEELTFAVLTDLHNDVARQCNLVFRLSPEVEALYSVRGTDLTTINGDDSWELPIPATYVVAPSGEIVYAYVNADYTVRPEAQEVIAALEAFRAQGR